MKIYSYKDTMIRRIYIKMVTNNNEQLFIDDSFSIIKTLVAKICYQRQLYNYITYLEGDKK